MSQKYKISEYKPDIRDLSIPELKAVISERGMPSYRASQIVDWLYNKRVESFECMKNISAELKEFLKDNYQINSLKILKKEVSQDSTVKYLLSLNKGGSIESVIIPDKKRRTICLSTQAGCRYGCSFCASKGSGFSRNLYTSEITGQLMLTEKDMVRKCTNIVFMGVGEPLDNLDNLIRSIEVFSSPEGFGIGRRKMTVSTCGLIPGIRKLSELKLGVGLSVSLHSAVDSIRSKLMPVNRIYPLNELKKAVRDFEKKNGYGVTLEYLLISGINTSEKDAAALKEFTKGLSSKLNLIPYNPVNHSGYAAPDPEEMDRFLEYLRKNRIFFTLRAPRGSDISAACGQLRLNIDKKLK